MSLCGEYKQQLGIINKKLEEKKVQSNNLSKKDLTLTTDINNLNFYKSNLLFSIQWMEQCHEPGVRITGIDNIKACRVYE